MADLNQDPGVKRLDAQATDTDRVAAEVELVEATPKPVDDDLEQPDQSKEPWRGDR